MIVFLSLCSASLLPERFGFYGAFQGWRKSPFRRFFLPITLRRRKNLQEMHFKTTESGATAHICTDKNRCGDGRESQTGENTET